MAVEVTERRLYWKTNYKETSYKNNNKKNENIAGDSKVSLLDPFVAEIDYCRCFDVAYI